jgi:hypothetical protein
MATVYRSYVELLSDELGALLHRLSSGAAPDLADRLGALLHEASDEAFMRVLTAPETSFRLLWHGDVSDIARAEFLLRALEVEAAREGHSISFQKDRWTALGDMGFAPGGEVLGNWGPKVSIPLDLGSPLAEATATGEMELDGERLDFQPFSKDEIALVLERIEAAEQGIWSTSPHITAFTATFTRVLICVKDAVAPSSFASGSTGQYVGRSFLANPQLTNLDEVAVADGIVHEAIHGLLFMQERRRAWVSDSLYMSPARILSPWTGTSLRLRPYLQACFVWYGLLHFWCMALTSDSFRADRARARIATAVQGFLDGPLIERIESFGEGISPELPSAIEAMQNHVVESITDTVPSLFEQSAASTGPVMGS